MKKNLHITAAAELVDIDLMKSKKLRDALLRAPREGSHPDLVEFTNRLLAVMKERSYPFFPVEFARSGRRQNEIQAAGHSRARAGQSPHNYGCAVDIVHVRDGWELDPHEDMQRAKWAVIGTLGKEVARKMANRHPGFRIVWGGDFKSIYDPAHWELANWREYRAAEAATRAAGVKLDAMAPDYHENLIRALDDALAKS